LRTEAEAIRKATREVIVGPLFVGKQFSGTTDGEKRAIMNTWLDAVEDFFPDEIEAAFKQFHKQGGTFPQPGEIISLADMARRQAEYDLVKAHYQPAPPPEPELQRVMYDEPVISEHTQAAVAELNAKSKQLKFGSGPHDQDQNEIDPEAKPMVNAMPSRELLQHEGLLEEQTVDETEVSTERS